MSEQNTTTGASEDNKKLKQARSFTYYIFAVVIALWVYTLWADRVTPMTDQARVNGQVIRISPEVSGPISQIHVANNATVKAGDELVNIDPRPFELAVKAARFDLQKAAQSYQADSAAINVAKANEVAARVRVANARKTLSVTACLSSVAPLAKQRWTTWLQS